MLMSLLDSAKLESRCKEEAAPGQLSRSGLVWYWLRSRVDATRRFLFWFSLSTRFSIPSRKRPWNKPKRADMISYDILWIWWKFQKPEPTRRITLATLECRSTPKNCFVAVWRCLTTSWCWATKWCDRMWIPVLFLQWVEPGVNTGGRRVRKRQTAKEAPCRSFTISRKSLSVHLFNWTSIATQKEKQDESIKS